MTQSKTFEKSARLLNAQQYSEVFNAVETRASTKHFLVLAKKNQSLGARLGIIVAKKHVKLAVDRNRIKRLMRETFRHSQYRVLPLDLVILAKQGAGLLDKQTCSKELNRLWQKVGQKSQ